MSIALAAGVIAAALAAGVMAAACAAVLKAGEIQKEYRG